MDAIQQHLLDTYRTAQQAEATPPAPGLHTARTVRAVRATGFRGAIRSALASLPRPTPTSHPHSPSGM
ncbi:hypothetical protein [Streptomyces sp. NPDC058989]|uniref:hypothetical protein n=1 Tax=Streptomyces sp. NPDC058989 TaxID=3346686 RepID=UPI003681D8C7